MDHPGFSEPRTKEEWRAYVLAEPPVRPVLPPTLNDYQALDADVRYNLDEQRFDYHSALVIVRTPAMQHLHATMRTTVRMNRCGPAGARRGHVLDGNPTIGKSTIVKTFGRDHELELRRRHPERFDEACRDYIPVVYVSIPASATPKMLSMQFAEYLGLPVRSKANVTDVTNAVLKALQICGTTIVIIDDIHFLDCSQKDGKLANDHLKYLANHCAATFIYAGVNVEDTSLFSEGTSDRATQTSGRFTLLQVRPFGEVLLSGDDTIDAARDQATQWARVVRSMEDALALYSHQPGTLTKEWMYLLQRTQGRISSLSGLIRAAAITAIETGAERIDRTLLETIAADWTAETEYQRRTAPKKRSRRSKKAA